MLFIQLIKEHISAQYNKIVNFLSGYSRSMEGIYIWRRRS